MHGGWVSEPEASWREMEEGKSWLEGAVGGATSHLTWEILGPASKEPMH